MENFYSFNHRVYYFDTDALGIVHHASYIKFCEIARTEMLREKNLALLDIQVNYGVSFAVWGLDARYHSPAHVDDQLIIYTKIAECRGASIKFDQRIMRGSTLIMEAMIRLVTVDENTKPIRMPLLLKKELIK